MKKYFLFVLVFFPCVVFSAGLSQTGLVKKIYQFPDYTMITLTNGQVDRSGNCAGVAYYVLKNTDTAKYDRMYSLVLGAYFAKTKLKFWLNDSCGGQNNAYQVISTIQTE